MSQIKLYPIACALCDYEATAKSLKLRAMYIRLHDKKCKKTGRTKKPEVMDSVDKQRAVDKNIRSTLAGEENGNLYEISSK